jgi:hypothetical protein
MEEVVCKLENDVGIGEGGERSRWRGRLRKGSLRKGDYFRQCPPLSPHYLRNRIVTLIDANLITITQGIIRSNMRAVVVILASLNPEDILPNVRPREDNGNVSV